MSVRDTEKTQMMKKWTLLAAMAMLVVAGCAASEEASAETAAPKAAKPSVDAATLDHYIRTQEALAADDFEAAKTAVGELASAAQGEWRTLAETAASAGDIEALRQAFKPLSDQILKSELPPGYASAYCPMADGGNGAYWAQREGEIANPYLGTAMLTCGSFQSPQESDDGA